MRAQPYKLRTFQGTMVSLILERDQHSLVELANRVSYVHAKVWPTVDYERDYQPFDGSADQIKAVVETTLRQFKGYALKVGLTPEAAVYLPGLIDFTSDELRLALTLGLETQARIKKEAAKMAKEDGVSGKAPRKLAGAAAAAVARKEQRLAAEAKKLVTGVSDDQAQAEEAGAADARLPTTPVKRSGGKGKPPKITKDTPSAAQAKKIVKGQARTDAQVSVDGQFDAAKLRGADGEYRSASAMFKGLLHEGKLSDDKIAAAVDKKFSLGAQKAKDYVKWNRGWFRRSGVKLADPK